MQVGLGFKSHHASLFNLYRRVSAKYHRIRVVFNTNLMACGTTIRVLMPILCLAHSIRLGLGLGLGLVL